MKQKKELQFRYKFDTDMYEVKHKCNKLSNINPPPSYKKVTSWTQQKMFKSVGESVGGKTQCLNQREKQTYVITSADKHTRVRYLSKKQMNHCRDLSQKGFFNIINAEKSMK